MKRIALILSLATLALTAPAQSITNTPPPIDEGSFISTVGSYFTSFNPALACTFTNKGTLWAGVDSNVGGGGAPPIVNELGFNYTVWGGAAPELVLRNGGISGVVDSIQAGVSYGYVVVDTRLAAYFDGGYSWDTRKGFAEIGLRVSKALTTHTFAYCNYGVQIDGGSGAPPQVIGGGVGFTF